VGGVGEVRGKRSARAKATHLGAALVSLKYPRKIRDSSLDWLFALPSETLQRALDDTLEILGGCDTLEHVLTAEERVILSSASGDESARDPRDLQQRLGSAEEKAALEQDIDRQRRVCQDKSSRRDFLLRHFSQLKNEQPKTGRDAATQLQTVRTDLERLNEQTDSLIGKLETGKQIINDTNFAHLWMLGVGTALIDVTASRAQPNLEPYVRADAKYVKKIMRWIASFNSASKGDCSSALNDGKSVEGADIAALQRELDRLEDATQKSENDLYKAELRLTQAKTMREYLSHMPHNVQQLHLCEASVLRENICALELESTELRGELGNYSKAIEKLNAEASQLRSVVILLHDHSAKRDRQQDQLHKQDELIKLLLDQQARHCVMLMTMRNSACKSQQTNRTVKDIQDVALGENVSFMRRKQSYEAASVCTRQSVCVRDDDQYVRMLHKATAGSDEAVGSMLTTSSLLKCAQECMGRIAEVQQSADDMKATQQHSLRKLESATTQLGSVVSDAFLQPPEVQQALDETHRLKEKAVQVLTPIFDDIKQRRAHLQSNPKAAAARDLFVDFYMNQPDVVSRLRAANTSPCGAQEGLARTEHN
jgi:hypothetical protein